MDREVEKRTHTALHVLKGAVYRVLGARWTSSTYAENGHGRLTVVFNRKPDETEVASIERAANKKIAENTQIEELQMDRKDAEARWSDFIYDVFPLPASVIRPKIVHIPHHEEADFWNVNACNKDHTRTTGEIGSLRISKWRFREAKQLLEISFDLDG